MMVAVLLPSLITMPMQFHWLHEGARANPATYGWLMALSMALGLLIVPLYAGYLQLIDATEHGRPARIRDIFMPYRSGQAWRILGFAIANLVVYVSVMGTIILATGGGFGRWYLQLATARAHHMPSPSLPEGFGLTMALLVVAALFMMGFYAIGLGQVAQTRRPVLGAIGDGLAGALKNVLPLLVLALSLFVALIGFGLVLGIVVILLGLVGALISKALVVVLIALVYLAVLLVMLTAMFGVMYYLWRDVCGEDIEAGQAPTIAA